MAKTKGPLLSVDAHGSFGRVLTYSHRKSGKQVRAYNKPLVAASAKQRGQRRLTEFLIAQWQNMSAGDKATWEANARLSGLNLKGYHYFLREAQRDLYTHHGLCGYWHCNEIVGGKVLDISRNANHGTLKPNYPANAPVLINSYKTKFSKGLLYDGVDEYVEVADSIKLRITTAITIEIWTYNTLAPNGGSFHQLFGKGMDSAYAALWTEATGLLDWRLRIGGANETLPSTAIIGTNEWQVWVFTYDGTDMNLYLNGGLDTTREIIGSIDTNALALLIGKDPERNYFWKGILDEVCVYNRALSATEIATRYKFALQEAG